MRRGSPHLEDGGLYGARAAYTQQAHLRLIGTAVHDNTAAGGDAITASNFADSLYIQTPLTIKVKDRSFVPLVWGGKTIFINPRTSILAKFRKAAASNIRAPSAARAATQTTRSAARIAPTRLSDRTA